MTKTIAKTLDMTSIYRKQAAYALLTVSAILLVAYISYVYTVVSRSVAIENAKTEMAEVSARVRELDQRFLELSSRITPDNLKQYGLSEGREAAFISRTASLGSVAKAGYEL